MQYSTNFNLNKPERADQYNLDHWNGNTDIIDGELNALQNITDSTFKTALLNFCYPVGSLYWSSKSTNPASLFGGTWVQIKDRFILACGDTYTSSGATGGASTVTLSVSNMPSHSHSFTPSGTITMDSHSHGLNNHSHSFSGTTGNMSANATGYFRVKNYTGRDIGLFGPNNGIDTFGNVSTQYVTHSSREGSSTSNRQNPGQVTINVEHFHYFSGTTGGNSGETTSVTSTGSFSGTQGTTSSNGSGTSFSILPPYVVKYCWERTA